MNFPSHLLLPLSGAVVLVASVVGTSLWPPPPVPQVRFAPPPPPAPVAMEVPAPAPPPRPRPAPRPVAQSAPLPVSQPVREPPRQAAVAPRPADVMPPPSSNPLPQVNAPVQREVPRSKEWLSMKLERVAGLVKRDVSRLEKERDAAAARGDEAERERLDTIIQRHHKRVEALRRKAPELTDAGINSNPLPVQ